MIQPQYLTLGQLVTQRLFHIPNYQRAYSCGKDQRTDLFNDINKTYETKRSEHFMAAIVGLHRENVTIGVDDHRVIEVVDGQQRLTTLILLLKAIEQAFDRNNPAQAAFSADLAKLLVKPDGDALLLLQTNHDTSCPAACAAGW